MSENNINYNKGKYSNTDTLGISETINPIKKCLIQNIADISNKLIFYYVFKFMK